MTSAAEDIRVTELSDIKSQMDTMVGRRIMWRLLESCQVFQPTFSPEPTVMAFNEGKRNMGLRFLADIMEVAPKKYMVMTLESNERREALDARLEKEREGIDE